MSDEELFDKTHSISLGKPGGGGRLLKAGDIVGGTYALKSLIGRGGMGYVFCAVHTIIEHEYALKIMDPDRLNEVNLKRFESEGRAIAALDHPNIVKVYNMGIDAGDCPYIVMDLLLGSTLARAIRSGLKLGVGEMLEIVRQTASGLGYAHSKGIVHRDIKPSNIMLVGGSDGGPSVRLVDFGLAKLAREDERQRQSLTSTGEVFGSPHYMSPEQCLGTKVDERSDIYSLGCTVYEMVMKKPPYIGRNPLETVTMHSSEAVPRFDGAFADPEIERKLNLLLSRMMAKRREDRYQNMAQIIHDLERIGDNKEIGRDIYTASSVSLPRATGDSPIARSSVPPRPEPSDEKATAAVRKPHGAIIIAAIVLLSGALVAAVHLVGTGGGSKKTENKAVSSSSTDRDINVSEGLGSAIPDPKDNRTWPTARARTKNAQVADFGRRLVMNEPRNKEAKLAFDQAGPITATMRGGARVIHFPAYPVGVLTLNQKNSGPAAGDRVVPPGCRPGLTIDWGEDSATLVYQRIFNRIDKNIFEALTITAWSVNVPEGKVVDIQVPAAERLLTVAASWPRLTALRVENFSTLHGDDRFLDYIDNLPHITAFSAPRQELDMRMLGRKKFVQRLQTLAVAGVPRVDEILAAVAGSSQLIQLQIPDTSPSVLQLQALGRCPNLHDLDLASCRLTHAHIEAISKLPVLNTVWLGNYKPSRDDLLSLAHSKSLSRIYLDKYASSPEEQNRWTAILPRIEFRKED